MARVSETDIVIAGLMETRHQIQRMIPDGACLAADANDEVDDERRKRSANVLGFPGVQRWRDTGRAEP